MGKKEAPLQTRYLVRSMVRVKGCLILLCHAEIFCDLYKYMTFAVVIKIHLLMLFPVW